MFSPANAVAQFPLIKQAPLEIERFDLLRQPLSLDVVRLVTRRYTPDMQMLRPGSPMTLAWSKDRDRDRFYGYVHSARTITENANRRIEVVGMGMPMVMLTKGETVYENMGPHNVLQLLADKHWLTVTTRPKNIVTTYEQAGRSDWEFFLDVSRKNGYVVLPRNGHLRSEPLDEVWAQSTRRQFRAKTFRDSMSPGSNLVDFERDLSGAKPSYEYGVDTSLGFLEFARTGTMEGLLTDRMFRDMFPHHAHAKMTMPFGIFPMDAMRVDNGSEVKTWAVLKIKYSLTPEGYYGYLDLGGDDTYVRETTDDSLIDLPTRLREQQTRLFDVPMLRNFQPFYSDQMDDTPTARWVHDHLVPPTVKEPSVL